MLTPCFEAEQDEKFVILTIRVPYVKIADAEIDINGKDFKFHCRPYFLWLQFSGEVVEDGNEKAQYDVNTGHIVVHVPKRTPGEQFTNLDMLTTLLGRKKSIDLTQSITHKPLIEVITDNAAVEEKCSVIDDSSSEGAAAKEDDTFTVAKESFDWKCNKPVTNDDTQLPSAEQTLTGSTERYGFANQHTGVFTKLKDEILFIIDCPAPDGMSPSERRVARIAHEQVSFDPDYYLADLMEDDRIQELLKFQPIYAAESFSDEEKSVLKELPNKEFLLNSSTERSLFLGLVDIIFAYAYNHRITEGENTVESAWSICKISSILSWFEEYHGNIHEVIYNCFRRSLCYPLYRHWELIRKVFNDICSIFTHGKQSILHCLLSLRGLLNISDPYYILNELYITDYCIWIQRVDPAIISSLADELKQVVVEKSSLEFELVELEEAARIVMEEEEEERTLSDSQHNQCTLAVDGLAENDSCPVTDNNSKDNADNHIVTAGIESLSLEQSSGSGDPDNNELNTDTLNKPPSPLIEEI